jgi:auxin influx carrier (AUX1 LAX family)
MNENNKLIYCLLVSLFGSEIMHAMWKPAKFKYIYLLATLYVFTLTLPSAAAMYWAFGDELLTHSNAFSLLPKTGWRDAAVILMLIHQFITFGFACTPLYFVWEKVIGMHDTKSIFKRALARLPIVVPIWFLAIIFPFFGPINSAVGALLVSFTVYIIPALAHILTYRTASARMVSALDPRPIHSFISYVHAGICIRRFASLK